MTNVPNGQSTLFEAFLKSAQYIVRIKGEQDVWEHVGKLIVTHFPADWVAFAEADSGGGISVLQCTPSGTSLARELATEEVRALVADVLESGFLMSRAILAPDPVMTAFLPIVEEYQTRAVMLVGHQLAQPVSADLLNVYLAVAGLVGTALERLRGEEELSQHRAHLEELVRVRTRELVEAQQHNELILQSVGEGICGLDLEGRITFVNPFAAQSVGWEPAELIGRDAHSTFHHTRPCGSPYPREECPVRSSMIGRRAELVSGEEFFRKDGASFPVEFAAGPIMHEGETIGAVLVFRDITARKLMEAEREQLLAQEQELGEELAATNEELQVQADELFAREEELQSQNRQLVLTQEMLQEANGLSQALNQANESLNSTLEFSEVLRRVVREGARALEAERAVLELREQGGWVVRELLGLPEDLRGLHLSETEASLAAAMAQQGDLLVIEDSRVDPRVDASTVLRYGTTAVLAVPVGSRGHILGSLQFIWASGPRTFSEPEIDFARKLTTSLGFALENARLHEEQKNIAEKLQETLLDIPEQRHGVQFGHLYRSATETASVGGDFYDVFEVKEGRIAVLIGDVSGHGVEAARIATLVKDVVHAFAHQFRRPSIVVRETNELLIEKRIPGFVTLFLGMLDPEDGTLTYTSAGHPNALVRVKSGEIELLEAASLPLGVFPDGSWKENEIRLEKQDVLLLYTDGTTEARRDGKFFGQEGLMETLMRWSGPSPELLPQAVLNDVLAFSGGLLTDDVAILALSLTDEPPGKRAKKSRRQKKMLGSDHKVD